MRDDVGAVVASQRVNAYARNTTTPVVAFDDTDANGDWAIGLNEAGDAAFTAAEDRLAYDVELRNGADRIWWNADDEVQAKTLQLWNADADEYALSVTRTEDAASVEVAYFEGDRLNPADLDAAYIDFRLSDSAGTQRVGARIEWIGTTILTGATGDTDLLLHALVNNTLTEFVRLDGSASELLGASGIDVNLTASSVRWASGIAVVGTEYSIQRDADGTNQLHLNVPTGATFEWSVNDAVEMTLSATAVNFQNNSITTTGGGSLTGTWTDLGTVTTVDINGGTLDGVVIGGASAAAGTFTTVNASGLATLTTGQKILKNGSDTFGTGPYFGLSNAADTDGIYAQLSVTNAWSLWAWVSSVATKRFEFSPGGVFFINDTANNNMTTGLTIQQAAADNEAQAWKSSDVGHPFTASHEADSYGVIQKVEAAAGGLQVIGFKDADGLAGYAVLLSGWLGEAADTTDTSSSIGVVQIDGAVTNGGTGTTAVAATGNVFVVSNDGAARLLVKGNGDLHVTNTTLVALDDYPDALVMRAGRAAMAPVGSPLHDDFQHLIAEYAPVLEERRIMFFERDSEGRITGAMNNVMASTMFAWDGLWQQQGWLRDIMNVLTPDQRAALPERTRQLLEAA